MNYEKLDIPRAQYGNMNMPRGTTQEKKNTYLREWRKRNPERTKLYKQKHYAVMNKNRRKLQKELREKIINLLGGECSQCGFADERALQIDHVNGGGNKHRKQLGTGAKFYRGILSNIDSGEYQILCANCNWIKRRDKGEF